MGDGGTGNFNAIDLIGEFVALRDEPGCLVQSWCDILENQFKEFCADKQTRKWSLNSNAYLYSAARKKMFVTAIVIF